MIELAKQLYSAGLQVFPCSSNKAPAVTGKTSWKDPQQQYPNAQVWPSGLVGVPIPSGVVVLDLDTYKGVTRQQVDSMLKCSLPWGQALIQTTPQGGQHYAFSVDWPVLHGSNINGLVGFDIRAAGKGYIATGEGYTLNNFGVFALGTPTALVKLPECCRPILEHTAVIPSRPERSSVASMTIIDGALRHLDPGCRRTEWLHVGLALRHQFENDESAGYEIFDRWSRGALTAAGEVPENYVPETMQAQWGSFQVDGGITIATLFYGAIAAGWVPPRNLDTAAAFGGSVSSAEPFIALIDRIISTGCDPKSTDELINAIRALVCSDLQRGMLTASLNRELKEAGLLTGDVRKQLGSKKPKGIYGSNHTENAVIYLESAHPDGQLRRSQQTWYAFNGKSWDELLDEDVKHGITRALASSFPSSSTTAGTYKIMSELVHRPGLKIGEMPKDLVLVQNGVLDLNSGALRPHSKDYFTTNILPYAYNIQARCNRWLKFLGQVFEGDRERICLLQEWFGYLLSGNYDHHKIMLLLGPSRCGKGTVGRIIDRLVGDKNFTGGSLVAFNSDPYVASLQTKTTVFIGDAEKRVHMSKLDLVVSRLKGISGGDKITFDRKWKGTLSEYLPARITLAANHIPKLFDDSGALASRLLVLPMHVSFYGREDITLFSKLACDIEGIAIWALQGLARLNENRKFTQPAESQAEIDYIREEYSPLRVYLDAVCILGGTEFLESKEVYASYRAWATLNQEDRVLRSNTFVGAFKDLTRGGACRYGQHRPQPGQAPKRGFKGLALRPLASVL